MATRTFTPTSYERVRVQNTVPGYEISVSYGSGLLNTGYDFNYIGATPTAFVRGLPVTKHSWGISLNNDDPLNGATDDGTIPNGVTLTDISVTYRVKQTGTVNYITLPTARCRRFKGDNTEYAGNGLGIPSTSWTNKVVSIDPDLAGITRANLFEWAFGIALEPLPVGFSQYNPSNAFINSGISIAVSFDTLNTTALTTEITDIDMTSARVVGSVNPGGATAMFPATYYVQYGLTTAFGKVTPTLTAIGDAAISVSIPLTDLVRNTTYYARLVSKNYDGDISNGATFVFTTLAADPVLYYL